eukprot:m51a1_g14043 hypothetical protein (790) ;mRNA; f:1177201-1179756
MSDWQRTGRIAGLLGDAYDSLGDIVKAVEYYETSRTVSRDAKEMEAEGRSCERLGLCLLRLGQHQRAVEALERRAEVAKRLGQRRDESAAYGALGDAYCAMGAYERAREMHARNLEIAQEMQDRADIGRAYGNLGVACNGIGDFGRALELHNKDLAIARGLRDTAAEGRALGHLGSTYQSLGDYAKAIDLHEAHMAIAREAGDRGAECVACADIGRAYGGMGDWARAATFHERHLALCKDACDKPGLRRALACLGRACCALGQHARALELLESSLSVAKELGDRGAERDTYGSIGDVCTAMGEHQKAIEWHQKQLTVARELRDRAAEGATYACLGGAYHRLGDYHRATELLEQGLAIATEVGDKFAEGNARYNLACAYSSLRLLALAITHTRAALALYDAIRGDAGTWERRVQIFKQQTEAFNLLVRVLLDKGCKGEALAVEDRLRNHMPTLPAAFDEGPVSHDEVCDLAQRNHVCFLVAKEFPDEGVWAWIVPERCRPSEILQERLMSFGGAGTGVCTRFRQLIASCAKGTVQQEDLLELSAMMFRNAVFVAKMRELCGAAPKKTVVWVPHGSLWSVPFCALVLPGSTTPLGDLVSVVTCPSLRVYKALRKRGHNPVPHKVVVVANPDPMPTAPLQVEPQKPIPGAEDEAKRIAGALKPDVQRRLFLGGEATKGKVLPAIEEATVVHLCTHGNSAVFYKNEMSISGALALTRHDPSSDDGWLRASDIQEFKLRGHPLVVLSYCAFGEGEGILGIARSWLFAGARGVVASLWIAEEGYEGIVRYAIGDQ